MIPASIQAGIDATQLLNVGDTVLETSVGAVRCVDVNSKKSPIGPIRDHCAFELKKGVLARRQLGTSSGRTGGTAALVEAVWCFQA